jgi:hypothetical protein
LQNAAQRSAKHLERPTLRFVSGHFMLSRPTQKSEHDILLIPPVKPARNIAEGLGGAPRSSTSAEPIFHFIRKHTNNIVLVLYTAFLLSLRTSHWPPQVGTTRGSTGTSCTTAYVWFDRLRWELVVQPHASPHRRTSTPHTPHTHARIRTRIRTFIHTCTCTHALRTHTHHET